MDDVEEVEVTAGDDNQPQDAASPKQSGVTSGEEVEQEPANDEGGDTDAKEEEEA